MSTITFDFNDAMARTIGAHGFTEEELAASQGMLDMAHRTMADKPMGFRRLPGGQEEILADIIETAAEIRQRFNHFVVLGIGGSALGPIAVHQALSAGKDNAVDFLVEDNVDPETMAHLLDVIDLEKTMFNVITKSGKTSETMAQMMWVAGALKKAGLQLKDHMIATTDAHNGNLLKIAQREDLKTFYIPSDVGGRFSVLCPVGLLPAAVCGYDIRALLKGAADMDALCSRQSGNPAALYALLHMMGMKKGMNISVIFPYADSLKYMADWHAQLWAESLGKKYDASGCEVYTGQTPVKALGVTDQHSQLQLYTEGPFDKITTFLKAGRFRRDVGIPEAFEYIDDIAFLAGQSFGTLIEAESSATRYALVKAGRPSVTITLGEVGAYTLGALIHFFEMATAYAGEMLHIDTFDQPGVEQGKRATFALMGKSGFEDQKAEIDQAPEKDPALILRMG